jgi:hypothetical protein
MIHDNYTIIKLQQNPKNHRPKNKTAPTFNKCFLKKILFQNKINNTKSPLKCGNQGGKKKTPSGQKLIESSLALHRSSRSLC